MVLCQNAQGPDLRVQARLLDVSAEKVLKGPAAASFEITQYPGWQIYTNRDGQIVESPFAFEGEVQLQVGDRGIFGLRSRPAGGYALTTHQSLFLFDQDGEVKKSARDGEYVPKSEQKTAKDLIKEIEAEAEPKSPTS